MVKLAATGLDGVVVKKLDEPYRSGERTGMVKIKRIRTADCVVGGFRYSEKEGGIGSLLTWGLQLTSAADARPLHPSPPQERRVLSSRLAP